MTHITRRMVFQGRQRTESRIGDWGGHVSATAINIPYPRIVARCVSTVLAMILMGSVVYAGEIFFDDFSDGDFTNDVPTTRDGMPVIWTPSDPPGIRDASSGDFVITALPESGDYAAADFLNLNLVDTSIRGQVRSTAIGGVVGFGVRNQDRVESQNYFGGIGFHPSYGGTILFLGRRNSKVESDYTIFGNPVPLPFDIRNEDAMLQLDAMDNELQLWAWQVGDPIPETPQVVAQDARYASGFVRIYIGTGPNKDNTGTFRFVQVADTHIFDPSILGDFDDSGVLDTGDVDMLVGAIAAGASSPLLDLSGDGEVNNIDLDQWLTVAADHNGYTEAYLRGDTNLNGSVGSEDLNNLALNWQKSEARWSAGDFTADGVVNAADLNQLGVNWRRSIPTAAQPVPEPATFVLMVLALPLFLRTTQRY